MQSSESIYNEEETLIDWYEIFPFSLIKTIQMVVFIRVVAFLLLGSSIYLMFNPEDPDMTLSLTALLSVSGLMLLYLAASIAAWIREDRKDTKLERWLFYFAAILMLIPQAYLAKSAEEYRIKENQRVEEMLEIYMNQ